MLPKTGLKALGHKGFKIGSIWDGYQNATSGTFQSEKCRFFHVLPRFRILFPGVRGVTQSCTAKTPQNPPKPGHFPGKLSGFLGSLAAKSKKEEFQ